MTREPHNWFKILDVLKNFTTESRRQRISQIVSRIQNIDDMDMYKFEKLVTRGRHVSYKTTNMQGSQIISPTRTMYA